MKITTIKKGVIVGGLAQPASAGELDSVSALEDFVTGVFTKLRPAVLYRSAELGEL